MMVFMSALVRGRARPKSFGSGVRPYGSMDNFAGDQVRCKWCNINAAQPAAQFGRIKWPNSDVFGV